MTMRQWFIAAIVGIFAAVPAARADVTPNPIFTDNMVIQRDVDTNVWGTADEGEAVTITLTPSTGKDVVTVPVKTVQGKWKATLPVQKAGTGFTLSIEGKNKIVLKNIAFGDVWICSGQSNMEWTLRQLPIGDQGKKVSAEAKNSNIRLFTMDRRPSAEKEAGFEKKVVSRGKDVKATFGAWEECTPETAFEFSAVGYYFGKAIESSQKVPVGLIATNWGGTVCEAWTSHEALTAEPKLKYLADNFDNATKGYDAKKAEADYQAALDKWKTAVEEAKKDSKPLPAKPTKAVAKGVHANLPTALFNGMISPLLPFKIKGAIWYQGESNWNRPLEYQTLFPAMITDWRKQWGYDFPFYFVQLAPWKGNTGPLGVDYAELREAQTLTLGKLKGVGQAVITDVGNEGDIHPQQKGPVGERLALAARAISYGEKIEFEGPTYKAVKIEGEKAIVTFTHAGKELVVKGKDEPLTGFTMCGEDKVFHPAKAEIKGDTVTVTCDKVTKPVAVRFGWVNFAKPTLNLFNSDGLPCVPFRTDDFPLVTGAKK